MKLPQDDSTGIGPRLRELRRARGLHQQDLASDEFSVSYVSLIETGKRTPSKAVLQALADRLGCSVEYLRSGRDDNRIKELELKIAFGEMALRNGENGEALQSFSEALADKPLLADSSVRRAQIGLALALEKIGSLSAAVQLLTDLYDAPATVVGSQEWSQIAASLCRCYRECGDLALSAEVGEKALQQLDQLGLEATDDYIQLGSMLIGTYSMRGDLTRAHLLANRLVATAEDAESTVTRGGVYWNAAQVAHARGATADALALTERALHLMAATDNLRHRALLTAMHGSLLMESDPPDVERSWDLFTQAHDILVQVGTAAEQARLENDLGVASIRLGRVDDALRHASRALGLLHNEPRWLTVQARATLAEAQLSMGDQALAEETLMTAARDLRQVTPSRQTALAWRRLGDLYQSCGKSDAAMTAFQRALQDLGLRGGNQLKCTSNAFE